MQSGSPSRRALLDLRAAPALVIGVTGHRDLRSEDIGILSKRVRVKLEDLQTEFPEARLIVMSALAEGADQLVADVAVKLGIEIVVLFPHRRETCRSTFTCQSDQEGFDRLLEKATAHFAVPMVEDGAAESSSAITSDPNLEYAALGRIIASSSDILLALWDGQPSDKMGGTAYVVRYMRTGHGLPESLARLGSLVDSPEHAIIYHLSTPRQQVPTVEQPFEWKEPLLVGGSKSEKEAFKQMHSLLRKMDRREDVAWLATKTGREKLNQSLKFMGVPSELEKMPEISSLMQRYAEADTLALRFQTITRGTFTAIFVLAVLSAFFVSAYWNWGDPNLSSSTDRNWWRIPEKHHSLVRAHAFLVLAGFGTYAWFRWWPVTSCHANRQYKHLDYRALAEALRVQIFWRLSGLTDSVSEKYLRRHRSPLDWVKSSLRLAYLDACADGPPTSPPQINAVIQGWVLGQAKYQRNNRLVRDEHRLHRLESASRMCFAGGILIMVFECVHHSTPNMERNALIFLAGFLPVLAGLLEFYLRVQGYKDHTHEARKMATIFLNAYRSLWYLQPDCAYIVYPGDKSKSDEDEHWSARLAHTSLYVCRLFWPFKWPGGHHKNETQLPEICIPTHNSHTIYTAQTILREAGSEALEENCDWFLMHRSREIEVPG